MEENKSTQQKTTSNQKNDKISFMRILDGGILTNEFLSRQRKLIALVMALTIWYVDNRYEYQRELIEIDHLKKDLEDIKYDALTRSSELMEKSRQSKIEEYVSANTNEDGLQTATNRPYLIKD